MMKINKLLAGAVLFAAVSFNSFSQEKKWTLKECVDYALENNISIKQSELDLEIAEENLTTSKGNFLPDLNASASQNWNFGSFIGQDGSRISRDSRGNSFGLTSRVVLFNGFQNTNVYKQAKLGIESSKLQLAILKDNTSLNVVNSFLNILLNKENLKVAKEQVNITQKQVNQIKELVDSGVRARADLLDVESQLASDKEQYINAENGVDLALLSLAQILQIEPSNFDIESLEISSSLAILEYDSAEEIYDYALGNRPEIRQANINIENSEFDIKIAKSAYYPTLSFGGSVSTSYQHIQGQDDVLEIYTLDGGTSLISNGFNDQINNNLGYNFGFSLNIPIFNKFQSKANVNRAVISNKRITFALEQEKQNLRSNIEQSFADAKAALKQYEASEVSLNSQNESFKNAQESYNLGVMNAFEFEQVRNRLVNAQVNLINSKYNYIFKTKVLDFYLGKPLTE